MKSNHNMPISEVAEIVGVTPRRINQLIEDRKLRRVSRGCVDVAFTLYLISGLRMVASRSNRPRDSCVLVAIAWLCGVGQPLECDIAALVKLFERNGYSRDEALIALGTARSWYP